MLWCYNGTYCGTDRVTHCDTDSSAHARAYSRPDDIVCTDHITNSNTMRDQSSEFTGGPHGTIPTTATATQC